MKILKGRIVEIESEVNRINYLTNGIKGSKQSYYDAKYKGGNGTYITGSEYLGTSLNLKVYVFDLGKCVTFDIRQLVLELNQKKRISPKLLMHIQKNKGKKINLFFENNSISFNPVELDLIR